MKRSASATWYGSLKDGRGELSSDSGVLSTTPYSFATRFENDRGTNPEELIGAAHAGCFSMALSMILGQHDVTPKRIDTSAEVMLDKVEEVLSYVEYFSGDLLRSLRHNIERALEADRLSFEDSAALLERFERGMASYTYLSSTSETSGSPSVPEKSGPEGGDAR